MARVYKRNDAWWIDYFFEGKRHRQKIGAKRKAEDALAQVRAKIASGDFVAPGRRTSASEKTDALTFRAFAESEFMPWSEMEHSASHHSRLKFALSKHVYPAFGNTPLDEITVKQIEDYKSFRRRAKGRGGKPVSEATVNRELCALKVILKYAVAWGKLDSNPATEVKTFKETPDQARLLEVHEIDRLLNEVPNNLRAFVSVIVNAGLRSAELYRLQWRDIDSERGELTVASRRGGATKNHESRRIPMNDALSEDLRRHPRNLNSPYVFCNSQGEPLKNVRKSLKSAAERAGIEGFVGPHQLRHAFCSHAQMQGARGRTVQGWMGHKSLATTERYAHVSPDHEKAAIQLLRYNTWHQGGTSAENQ